MIFFTTLSFLRKIKTRLIRFRSNDNKKNFKIEIEITKPRLKLTLKLH